MNLRNILGYVMSEIRRRGRTGQPIPPAVYVTPDGLIDLHTPALLKRVWLAMGRPEERKRKP